LKKRFLQQTLENHKFAKINHDVKKHFILILICIVSCFSDCKNKNNHDSDSMQPIDGYPRIDNVDVIKQILEAKCLDTISYKKGEIIADIGAGNGYIEAMLSLFHDSLTFYIQDIDTSVCNQIAVDSTVAFYQRIHKIPFTNKFIVVNGSDINTNLPDTAFDKVLMLWTYQYFKNPKILIADLWQKLKPNGLMYIINPNINSETGASLTAQYGWNASPIEKQISDILQCNFELINISRNLNSSEKPYIMVFKKKL
jgi:SAM-dependent methyltransferase